MEKKGTEHIIRSQYDPVDIPDISITDFVMKHTHKVWDKPALMDAYTDKTYRYGDLSDLMRRVASGLVRAGLKKGDVVCMFSTNHLDFHIAVLGILAAGGIMTACNPLYTSDELARHLSDSCTKFIITIPNMYAKVKQATQAMTRIKNIYVFGGNIGEAIPFSVLVGDTGNMFPYDLKISPKEDVACLLYSSGTTGLPKGVMITHHNIVSLMMTQIHSNESMTVGVSPIPPFHVGGFFTIFRSYAKKSYMVIMSKFDLDHYLSVIEKYKMPHIGMVPPMALLIAKDPRVRKYDLSSIKTVFVGAAPLGKEAEILLCNVLGDIQIRQVYGMTECPNALMVPQSHKHAHKGGSVGRLIINTMAKVIDIETGYALGPNKPGELCVKSPAMMKGYWNNPSATANTIDRDGWLHTGDIAYYDEDEYFFIVDRLKELIKYKAFQVPPAELEAVLIGHPDVADVAVVGVPDEDAGELPKAVVVKKQNSQVTATDIIKYVQAKCVYYKWLRGGVEFVSEIPKNPSGKILRRKLKKKEKFGRTSKI